MACSPLSLSLLFFFFFFYTGGAGEEQEKLPEEEEEDTQILRGSGHCKWFNVRMGFGFISMTSREGSPLENPVDVFVHQVSRPSSSTPLSS